MKLAWITDPHFDHCRWEVWERLVGELRQGDADAVVISGDISEGEDVLFQLRRLADRLTIPIHFVLGNHDFYRGGIARTRATIAAASQAHPWLNYLTDSGPVSLSDRVVLVGEDGWGDATLGDFEGSPVRLHDFQWIDDFRQAPIGDWRRILIEQGRQAAERLRDKLHTALASHDCVLVATHVPPFREACWYQGRTTDDWWAPFFVCGQVGEVLREAAKRFPQRRIEVLCGHTHHGGVAKMTERMTVTTAGAEYGQPEIAAWLGVATDGFQGLDGGN